MDFVRIDCVMPSDQGVNFHAQDRQQVRVTDQAAVVFKQVLQPFARHRCRIDRCSRDEAVHAALRPSNFVSRLLLSLGTVILTQSPLSLRAASKYARDGALSRPQTVIGAPRLEARSTSRLSGTIPSSGSDRISSTSSMLSISPRAARIGSNRVTNRCFFTFSPPSAF